MIAAASDHAVVSPFYSIIRRERDADAWKLNIFVENFDLILPHIKFLQRF